MRIAVPLFGNQVAPRFEFASRFLISDIEEGEVLAEENCRAVTSGCLDCLFDDLLVELASMGVKIILCYKCDLSFFPLAESRGIHVIDGVRGDARQTIRLFAGGKTWLDGDQNGHVGRCVEKGKM